MSKPEFPRPSVGDELIVVRRGSRNHPREIISVRVKAVARFRITLEGPDGECLPWMYAEIDIRSRYPWTKTRSDRIGAGPEYRLHTPETLAYDDRVHVADEYLREHSFQTYQFRGTLRKAYDEDPLGFVNLLRRFAGEEEI